MARITSSLVSAGIAVMAGALLLSGCSGDAGATTADAHGAANTADVNYHTAKGAPDAELQAKLPKDVADAGTLVIATDATIGEPFASYDEDNTTIVGLAPDLAYAIGDELGLNVELHHVVFANLIPGLEAERYQFSVAPMLDTTEREKQVDFIDYIHGGSAFIVAKDGDMPRDLTVADMCGLRVGVAQGSVEEIAMGEQTTKCTDAGKKPIQVLSYKTNNEGILALTSDRADVYATAAAQAGYIAKNDDKRLATSGDPFSSGLSGMAFPSDSALLPVVQAALQKLIDSGAYTDILASYGVDYLSVERAGVNNEELAG
jgi:polar amino acid transport system substrate-binding protein